MIQLARGISVVLHPVIWAIVAMVSLSIHQAAGEGQLSVVTLGFSIGLILIPMGLLVWLRRIDLVSDWDVRVAGERRRFLKLVVLFELPVLVGVLALSKYLFLTILVEVILIELVSYLVLSRFIKPSLHMGIFVTVVLALCLMFGWELFWLMLLVLPLGWSRYTLKHHSVVELASGTMVGIISVVVVIYFNAVLTNF